MNITHRQCLETTIVLESSTMMVRASNNMKSCHVTKATKEVRKKLEVI